MTKTVVRKNKEDILKHLSRIEGQIRGIKKMVEEDRYCAEVLTQISAVDKSIKSVGYSLLENHMHCCVKENILKGNDEIICEVMDIIRKID